VSKYKEFSDWYHKVTNPSDSVEVRYYVWQKDYDNDTTIDGSRYNARYAFKKTPDMMKCFSTYYGEYPYVKYGMAAVIPFNAGGMEHQTMTTVHRIWLRGNWYESGIAHELSHQWLGDKITCATWADIWINEGGATFSEAIWAEYAYGKQAYVNTIMGSGQGYLYDNSVIDVPIYNLPINNLFNGSLTYNKGGFVYHMLRTMLGDSAFFTSLRDVLSKYAFNSITTDQFRDVFKADNPSPLVPFDTFFNQWIYKAGHPIFNIMTTANGNNNNVHVIISQTQSGANIPDVFLVPIKLIFFGPNSQQYIDTVMDYQRTTGYDFALPFHPDSVQIDSSYILCRTDVNSWQITSVREVAENNFESIKIVPNPVAGGSEASFNITLKESEPVDAYLVDMSGRKVSEIYKGSMNTGSYTITFPTTGLASGVYLLCCRIGANVQTDMLNIIY
jgi:aminopeptidase N